MTTFPSLKPSSRTYTPGEYPHTPFSAYSGLQNRVRHSNVMLSSQLRLNFVALTETQMLSILVHYQGQFGSYESFDLSADVWSGTTSIAEYNLSNYLWRYTESPTVEDTQYGRYNVDITLETVPPDGANIDGPWFIVSVNVTTTGAAAASGFAKGVLIASEFNGYQQEGFTSTVSYVFVAGAGAASSGAMLNVTAALTAGNGASSGGAALSIATSLIPGAASTTTPASAPVDSLTRLAEDDLLELLF